MNTRSRVINGISAVGMVSFVFDSFGMVILFPEKRAELNETKDILEQTSTETIESDQKEKVQIRISKLCLRSKDPKFFAHPKNDAKLVEKREVIHSSILLPASKS